MSNLFARADKEIARLRAFVGASFQNAANELPFDELNVIAVKGQAQRLYNRLIDRNRKAYERIALEAYEEALAEAKAAGFDSTIDQSTYAEKSVSIVLALFQKYHPTTEYVYNNEVLRKRDRFAESISSSDSRNTRLNAYRRAARLWFNQSQQYADLVVDEARIQAFHDAGVQRVRWVTQRDERVCSKCAQRDGQIYLISEVPEIPAHYHCRCYLVAVRED